MYYVDQSNLSDHRYIRVEGQQHQENQHEVSKAFTEENFNSQIEVSPTMAWLLLLTSVLFSAFVPCWLLADVRSEPLTRNSWRYFIVSVLAIPFMLHEQRNNKDPNMKFWNLLTSENLKPIFVGSLNFCIWLICLIYACNFTSMNHALCLSYMRFFLISVVKMFNKEKIHEFEIAGTILCTIGVVLVMSDSITVPLSTDPHDDNWKRV